MAELSNTMTRYWNACLKRMLAAEAALAAMTAERDEAVQSSRTLSRQLERRANGADDLTRALVSEKDELQAQLAATTAELDKMKEAEKLLFIRTSGLSEDK